ncbi:MAG: hypothetical protein A4E29_00802 [Methanomassiliicoccales archaeon PtaB.Bin134]|nr:MAG: hypothetical protein A4E29_00802 [Methanomassiliicoccales archaeon PtaB.Bin134]
MATGLIVLDGSLEEYRTVWLLMLLGMSLATIFSIVPWKRTT